ncbi:MAG: glucosaminidase domain-containing protein [Flavobacteriales bacterium]|nr:glucosaminidase domain-containing protein [Flavobacteriales bacterium]
MQSNILTALFLSCNLFIFSMMGQSQPSEPRVSKSEYIENFRDEAIREMHGTGIPASITLAQGMLESDYGNSPLAKYANNHFGIKCHRGWEGPSFIQDDDEANECFRKYFSAFDSYRDHSEFLMTRDRYASLFEFKATDYKAWARGLKKAGYATNLKYADLLIKIIEENELHQYDRVRKLPDSEPVAEMRSGKEEAREEPVPHVMSVSAIDVSENNIKFVLAKKGDSPLSVSERYGLSRWQIVKYNDLNKDAKLLEGEVVYIQPKRNNAQQEFHTVQNGETMRDVSQRYGVKMNRLLKMNDLDDASAPKVGDKLKLRNVGFFGKTFLGH